MQLLVIPIFACQSDLASINNLARLIGVVASNGKVAARSCEHEVHKRVESKDHAAAPAGDFCNDI
jgi:hypothetical protein